jgi:hypothetical protein
VRWWEVDAEGRRISIIGAVGILSDNLTVLLPPQVAKSGEFGEETRAAGILRAFFELAVSRAIIAHIMDAH